MGRQMQLFCAHLWEQGKQTINQDSLAFWHMKKGEHNVAIGIICDGIGGLQEGENASGYVVRQSIAWFLGGGYKIKGRKKLNSELQQFFYQLHEELKEYGGKKNMKLGTTVTFFMVRKTQIIWGHCGDCRLYFIRGKRIKQLTEDHCQKTGVLNQAIGVGDWHLLTMGHRKLRRGDKLLLCTDGFYGNVRKEDLLELFQRNSDKEEQAERMLRQWYQRKISMGERDNISALYFGLVEEKTQ